MLKSILNAANDVVNATSVDSMVLDILIILGVVVAGALVLYFIWEAISNLLGKNKEQNVTPTYYAEQQPKQKDVFIANYTLDEEKNEDVVDEQKLEEVDKKKAEEEKAEAEAKATKEEQEIAERRAYLEARRQELIRRMQSQMQNDEEEEEESDEQEPAEEETEQEDQLAEERRALAEEKARYAAMVRELEQAKAALEQQKAQDVKPVTTVVTNTIVTKNGALTLDELREKLAETEERLRDTEKEFKQCKKEYTPLRRIWANHERDERKLRRKEALVAKQKVILYGVNNYADIDEERAKKLAEDLDHLDGLKLSVQHCEEVMKENADRYPLLEKMYGVLKQRNDDLKRDIAYYRAEIARLEAEEENN